MFLRDFRSSVTGIVVNVLYLFYNLNVNEIWVECGGGQYKRFYTGNICNIDR